MELDIKKLRKEEGHPHELIFAEDGISLYLREWKPETETDTAILILHGITAHSRPYQIFAKPMMEQGYAVYGLDLRGHGLSEGKRGDLSSREELIDDLGKTIEFLAEEYDNIIIFGHSLGVVTSIILLDQYPEFLDGIILASAAREPKPDVYPDRSLWEKIKIFLQSQIMPGKPIIEYSRDGMLGKDDPLFNFHYTLRFFKFLNASEIEIPDEIEQPMLFVIGDQDEIFSVEGAQDLYYEFPNQEKEFYVIEGAKHAEFPPIEETVIISWLTDMFPLGKEEE